LVVSSPLRRTISFAVRLSMLRSRRSKKNKANTTPVPTKLIPAKMNIGTLNEPRAFRTLPITDGMKRSERLNITPHIPYAVPNTRGATTSEIDALTDELRTAKADPVGHSCNEE